MPEPIPQPDFTLPDPQRVEFEKKYPGMARPHFGGGDVTNCRSMTKLELEQYREYCRSQGVPIAMDTEYKMPF